jgi:hypothetical protein
MANSLSTKTLRDKYRLSQLDIALRSALVAEKVCMVDRTENKTISSPYLSAVTATVQAVVGTYSPAAITTTDDTLTVADEVVASTHIFGFEDTLSNFDLFFEANRELTSAVAVAIDKFVLNNLCEDGTGSYTTPAGGFTTAANVSVILSNIISKVAGYSEMMNGLYVIVENTDLTGIIQSQVGLGYSYADAALNNGFVTSLMGVDIYVVRSGTFVDETTSTVSGSKTWTNLNHRVGGVKNVTTYAAPRGITYDEKGVTGKTGKEIVVNGLVGFKAWTPRATLTIDITLA